MTAYIAFFDLDGTILDTSSAKLFIKYLFQNRRIGVRDLLEGASIGIIHRLGIMNTEKQVKQWVMKYKGQLESETLAEVRQWFETDVKFHIRKSMVHEMEMHRRQGGRLVILSAATDYICNIVKNHLSMDEVICTRLEVENGRFTGKLLNRYCYGEEKLARAITYCRYQGFPLDTAYCYGDSLADAHVMKKTRYPVCVDPDWRLLRLARKKEWRIIKD